MPAVLLHATSAFEHLSLIPLKSKCKNTLIPHTYAHWIYLFFSLKKWYFLCNIYVCLFCCLLIYLSLFHVLMFWWFTMTCSCDDTRSSKACHFEQCWFVFFFGWKCVVCLTVCQDFFLELSGKWNNTNEIYKLILNHSTIPTYFLLFCSNIQ